MSFASMHDDYLDPDRWLNQEEVCQVCARSVDDCDCPECPQCGSIGDPECYGVHQLEPAHDSVQSLCDKFGIEPVAALLRAVEKYNIPHLWLVFPAPLPNGKSIVYYHDDESMKFIKPWMRLDEVGVSGIAWDGSDWEFTARCTAGDGWEALDRCFESFDDALEEHNALMLEEEWDEDGWGNEDHLGAMRSAMEPVRHFNVKRGLTSTSAVLVLVGIAVGLWIIAGATALAVAKFLGWF